MHQTFGRARAQGVSPLYRATSAPVMPNIKRDVWMCPAQRRLALAFALVPARAREVKEHLEECEELGYPFDDELNRILANARATVAPIDAALQRMSMQ